MKKEFKDRLEAIDWMAQQAEDEARFEVWREELMFNYLYTDHYYIYSTAQTKEIVMLSN